LVPWRVPILSHLFLCGAIVYCITISLLLSIYYFSLTNHPDQLFINGSEK
jgi:hypothetical protein